MPTFYLSLFILIIPINFNTLSIINIKMFGTTATREQDELDNKKSLIYYPQNSALKKNCYDNNRPYYPNVNEVSQLQREKRKNIQLSQSPNMGKQNTYQSLDFQYEELKHQYSALENEYRIYTEEALTKVSQLQEQMDVILQEKQKIIKRLKLEKENIKNQYENLIIKNQNLEELNEKMEYKCQQITKDYLLENQHQQLTRELSAKKLQHKFLLIQEELSARRQAVQSLKDILNQERIQSINKDNLLISRENQISRLSAEIKHLNLQLDMQIQNQQAIKDTNYRLKNEVEELKRMFEELLNSETYIRGRRNQSCQKCRVLTEQNRELICRLRIGQRSNHENMMPLKSIQLKAYDCQDSNYWTANKKLNHSHSFSWHENLESKTNNRAQTQKRRPLNYKTDNKINLNSFETIDSDHIRIPQKYQQAGRMAQVKESIVYRCKKIIENV